MRENDVRAPFVWLYEYARDPRVGRMLTLTVFGGRPISITVIVEEVKRVAVNEYGHDGWWVYDGRRVMV